MPRAFLAYSVALLSVFLSACSDSTPRAVVAEPVRAIKYLVAGEDTTPRTRELSGYIQARERSQLSFQVAGQVKAVSVQVGDTVKRGDVIAELDPKPYEFKLSTAEAELSSAQSGLREQRQNYRSQQRVFEQRYISKRDLERAKADYEKAESSVKLAASQLKLAQRDLQNTRLLAPFTGTINRRDVEPFEDVAVAHSLFEIQGTAGFEVALLLPSRLVSAVVQGTEAVVHVPALGDGGVAGVVTERGLRSDSRGAFPVTVGIEEADAAIQSGMSAQVTLNLTSESRRLLLPGSAVVVDGSGSQSVIVFDATTSVVRKTAVKTQLSGVGAVVVDSGVSVGDIVAVAGVEFLRDGQEVTLYDPAY